MRILNLGVVLQLSFASMFTLSLLSCSLPPRHADSMHSASPSPVPVRNRNWNESQINRAQ